MTGKDMQEDRRDLRKNTANFHQCRRKDSRKDNRKELDSNSSSNKCHNYLKPGSKVRGGKRGTDYFNGEDELLAYVRRDTELCAWLNIANVWVRPPSQAIQSTIDAAASDSPTPVPDPPEIEAAIAPKRDVPASGKAPAKKRVKQTSTEQKTAKPFTKKTKKMTEKQLDKEAADRRRELSSLGRVWGGENAQVGHMNGDVDSVIAGSSDGENSEYVFDESDGDDSESEGDTGDTTRDDDGVTIPPATVRIEFAVMEATDPNLVLGEGEDFLDSDGERSDDLVETAETFVDEDSSESEDTNESVAEEVSRMIGLMKPAEIDDMRLRGRLKFMTPLNLLPWHKMAGLFYRTMQQRLSLMMLV
ncbi:hypothetical protein PInf_022009 [Phytophthora infestans]|nr:hypothetical protein PInf_022009 [Phytophthora infestans]